jgi:hypothetical protein
MPKEIVLKEELAFYFLLEQVHVGCPQLLQAKEGGGDLRIRYDNLIFTEN